MFAAISTTVKLGALCVLIALLGIGATYSAWQIRSNKAAQEVQDAKDAKDKEILQERLLTKEWSDRAAALAKQSQEKKNEAIVVTKVVTEALKVEREAKPEFYDQPIPQGGVDLWEAARKLMQ